MAQHKKFPRPPIRTQKRRLLRERAIARREESAKLRKEPTIDSPVIRDQVGSKSKFGRSATEDKFVDDDDDLLSEEDDQRGKTINFCVGEFHITVDCATGVVILPERFKMMEEEDGELMPKESMQKKEHANKLLEGSSRVFIKEDHPNKPKQVILEKPTSAMTKHIRPLYIKAHVNGKPVSKVLIDNGSAVNVLPVRMLRNLGKTKEDLIPTEVSVAAFIGETTKTIGVFPADVTVGSMSSLCAFLVVNSSANFQASLGRDWIHANQCIPSSIHQLLLFWKGDDVEVVEADGQPFQTTAGAVEARYYNGDFGPIKIRSNSKKENPLYMQTPTPSLVLERILKPTVIVPPRPINQPLIEEVVNKLEVEEPWDTYGTEIVQEEEYEEDELQFDELLMTPSQIEDGQHEVQDPLEEINLGELENPKVVYVSKLLEELLKQDLISTLKEYKDCFAWSYDDMPGLDRKLVEHRIPLKEGFKPFHQPSRRMSKEVELKVKEEVEKLLKDKFIKQIRYTKWLSNIVPVMKKNDKVRICIEFRDLNCATPKDVYVMPIPDMLIDFMARHELLSFMDGFSRYNQIKIVETDTYKTAFRCPGAVGTFECLVIPFELKNAGATYQRAMNSIFHDMIEHHIKVYIDDIVVKSKQAADHIEQLRKSFQRMRQHELKLNPSKCAFCVKAGNLLGFLVHQRGVEVDKNKAKAIMEANLPRNKKELQRFLGQVNYLRSFISKLAGKTKEFSQLLKLKDSKEFEWEELHQKAFDVIKIYLSNPPVLMPPKYGMPLKLYISDAHESIGCLLVQNNHERNEQAIYYLSRFLTPVEVKYSVIEKLCLTLYYACTKLRHYLIQSRVFVVAITDLIKYMLNRPILSGRIGKWSLALAEFTLTYYPQKSVKGQAIADFLADHPSLDEFSGEQVGFPVCGVGVRPWELKFDGSSTETTAGAGIAEYEALVIGLEILKDLGAKELLISGDSHLILKQLSGEFKCTSLSLAPYYTATSQLLDDFEEVSLVHVPRQENWEADELAQVGLGLKMSPELTHRLVLIQKKNHPSIQQRGIQVDTLNLDINLAGDWRVLGNYPEAMPITMIIAPKKCGIK
ncbi:uncharacterized protein LOC142550036 [Primulina tabacum]|uniref:uncharacterized protein LOC142550036 n=1 Tax=Primulina tabacum TaxID=48773 RepID=UPI003F59B125